MKSFRQRNGTISKSVRERVETYREGRGKKHRVIRRPCGDAANRRFSFCFFDASFPGNPGPMLGDKLRFRFSKTGTLRLLSHHDLMRCLERMLRRAALPFKSTAGFHPGPRVVFALSLPLGVAGLDEVVEIEFLQPLDDA